MQGVAGSRFHRVVGGQKGLRDNLPAEQPPPIWGTAWLCSKRIVVNPFDLQLFNQHLLSSRGGMVAWQIDIQPAAHL
jgi:hypothetical protein